MRYTNEQLVFSYDWPTDIISTEAFEEEEAIDGINENVFNPKDGRHVLLVINRFMDENELQHPSQGRNLERLIYYAYPPGEHSWKWVLKWLGAHYRQ